MGMALLSLFCSACSRHRHVAHIPSVPRRSSHPAKGATPGPNYTEVGYASWYGDPYHGRRAADGEIYDKNKLTAAHLTLPFGTQVKVTDLGNQRSVVVRITDRGPFVKGRIIDLSLAGAKAIQLVGPGVSLVRLETVFTPEDADPGQFAVQVGAFRDHATAERLRETLAHRYSNAFIQNFDSPNGLLYRVRVRPKPNLEQAGQLAAQLGRESMPTFVVRVDDPVGTFVTAKK